MSLIIIRSIWGFSSSCRKGQSCILSSWHRRDRRVGLSIISIMRNELIPATVKARRAGSKLQAGMGHVGKNLSHMHVCFFIADTNSPYCKAFNSNKGQPKKDDPICKKETKAEGPWALTWLNMPTSMMVKTTKRLVKTNKELGCWSLKSKKDIRRGSWCLPK